jgi:hypothetical protein
MVGEDIEVTQLQSEFFPDVKNGKNLISRRFSRGVVGDCFHRSEFASDYAMVGSPGIGKSWTLIYALQQALLDENVCVFFVWTMEDTDTCDSRLFQNTRVLVLLDSTEA